jgi:hypothetical protein
MMKNAFILFGIAIRNMLGYSYTSPAEAKTEAEIVRNILK